MKKSNKDSDIEVTSIVVTNSQGQKSEGLKIDYGAELWGALGGLGCSSTMMFVSSEKISQEGIVKPVMCKKIVEFMKEFLENYLEDFSEELKKPLKTDE